MAEDNPSGGFDFIYRYKKCRTEGTRRNIRHDAKMDSECRYEDCLTRVVMRSSICASERPARS